MSDWRFAHTHSWKAPSTATMSGLCNDCALSIRYPDPIGLGLVYQMSFALARKISSCIVSSLLIGPRHFSPRHILYQSVAWRPVPIFPTVLYLSYSGQFVVSYVALLIVPHSLFDFSLCSTSLSSDLLLCPNFVWYIIIGSSRMLFHAAPAPPLLSSLFFSSRTRLVLPLLF